MRTSGSATPSDAINILSFDPDSIRTNLTSISPYQPFGVSN